MRKEDNMRSVEKYTNDIMKAIQNIYSEGLFDGYKKYEKENKDKKTFYNDWNPCDTILPNDRDMVLVSILDESGDSAYDYVTVGWYNDDHWIVDDERNNYVVAWAPFPLPITRYMR